MGSVVRIIPKSSTSTTSTSGSSGYLLSSLVLNSTGATMPAGMAVYVTQSANGLYSEIHPADPRDLAKSDVLGVLPTPVFSGVSSRVAIGGLVPFLLEPNLNVPASGTTLYLSKTNPGHLTTELDEEGNPIRVGTLVAGKLVIDISKPGDLTPSVNPEESLWGMSSADDLVITSLLTGRMGSWVSTFSVDTLDSPPIVEWEYSDAIQNNATVKIQNKSSRAKLSISNMDVQPKPLDIFPDIHWNNSGNDLIPRSAQ